MPTIKRRSMSQSLGMSAMISVDPGLSGTGVVYWQDAVPYSSNVFIPPQSVTRKDVKDGEEDLVARARYLGTMIRDLTDSLTLKGTTVVIEFPEFQGGAERQMGWKTGSLQKLTFLVGVMVGVLPVEWRVILVPPSGWKGQLPKDVVERRMKAKYGADKCAALRVKTHAWDAMGIGEWAWRQEFMQ